MPGPAPKPTALKMLQGNPGKRSLNPDAEPQPDASMPECPDWLDDSAKEKWAELAPELHRLGLLTCVDGDNLAAYCQAFAEFKHSTVTLREEGREMCSDKGNVSQHPAVLQQRSAWAAMQKFSAMFGLDPSARTRLPARGRGASEDPFDSFLKQRA